MEDVSFIGLPLYSIENLKISLDSVVCSFSWYNLNINDLSLFVCVGLRKMSKKRPTSFNEDWKIQFPWIQSVPNDKASARCLLCETNFKVGNSGKAQVKQHSETEGHKALQNLQSGKTSQSTLSTENGTLKLSSSSKSK